MVAEQDEEIVFPISGRVVYRRAGDALHAARFPKSWCEKQERTVGRVVWSSQYQQRPSPLAGNLVKVDDIQFYGGKDLVTGEQDPQLPAAFERKIVSVDCSFKDKSSSDYVAILVIGIVGSRRYVLHIVNSRLDLDGTENEIRHCYAAYGPINAVLIEDKANGSAVVSHLKEEIAGVIAVNPEGGKMSRMMAASPEFQSRSWFFDRTGAWTNKAIDQLCLFPAAKNDDIADAVSQAAIWLQANTYQYGLLDLVRDPRRVLDLMAGKFSRRKPAAKTGAKEEPQGPVTRDQWEEWQRTHRAPPCPHTTCQNASTTLVRDARGAWHIRCLQCQRIDGIDQRGVEKPGHVHRWRPIPGGLKCDDCEEQKMEWTPVGASFKDLRRRRFG